MGRIDSISQALETEHGFDLSTGKIVNVEDHHNMTEKTLLPSDVLKQLDEDDDGSSELVVYGDPEDDDKDKDEKKNELVVAQIDEDEVDEECKKDEALVKENIRELIDKSMDMADELIEIVRISESPKSFDSAANFLRAIAELNEKLLDVHDRKHKRKAAKKKEAGGSATTPGVAPVQNTQNNTIICKDPADILKMLNSKD